ncbi:MAG: TonB-dependent receptor [Bacteroidia bacterium]|nr:TonB-dependent receptor [Bacteroidia bacterium]
MAQDIELSSHFNISGAVRFDHFRFAHKNLLTGEPLFRNQARSIISPKINISFNPSAFVKIYFNNGIGFHSNDTRVILNNSAEDILPKVFSTDLGVILKPIKNLILKTALWHLFSEQEFVYVGDAGIIEPGGETRRMGIDVSVRYQFSEWLYGDVDVNYTKARSVGVPKGEDYVPLAPSFTSIGCVTAKGKNGFSGSLRYRWITDRPANETNTIRADGYFILDGIISYQWKRFEMMLSAENILNREWKEAQFDTESKLKMKRIPFQRSIIRPVHLFILKGESPSGSKQRTFL